MVQTDKKYLCTRQHMLWSLSASITIAFGKQFDLARNWASFTNIVLNMWYISIRYIYIYIYIIYIYHRHTRGHIWYHTHDIYQEPKGLLMIWNVMINAKRRPYTGPVLLSKGNNAELDYNAIQWRKVTGVFNLIWQPGHQGFAQYQCTPRVPPPRTQTITNPIPQTLRP